MKMKFVKLMCVIKLVVIKSYQSSPKIKEKLVHNISYKAADPSKEKAMKQNGFEITQHAGKEELHIKKKK